MDEKKKFNVFFFKEEGGDEDKTGGLKSPSTEALKLEILYVLFLLCSCTHSGDYI